MKFISTLGQSPPASFRDALLRGLAPDGSLYVPESLPTLQPSFFGNFQRVSLHSIGQHVASLFIEEIPAEHLRRIVQKAWDFPIPLMRLDAGIALLELFHGPTLAFKDVGARFMAHALSYFLAREGKKLTILVATSGDTGSAVAQGFFNIPHITVYILYPSGKISHLQEQQMTTLGGNIRAMEIAGTFDDCQRIVKESLVDRDIVETRAVTTANSINIGRLLPQVVYYVWGFAQWKQLGVHGMSAPIVVVPSGNFGNLTAAVYAKWMGLPIRKVVAATNANDVVPQYLASGKFIAKPSVQTLSNAMDVGNPSNLARLQALYHNEVQRLREDIDAASISDEETLDEIRHTYDRTGYILDPHTAVGIAAMRKVVDWTSGSPPVIVAATAHPAKFPEVIRLAINRPVPLPPELQEALRRRKKSIRIGSRYQEWKEFFLSET